MRPVALKIGRAKYHIKCLNEVVSAYLSRDSIQLVIVDDIYCGERRLEVQVKESIPEDISLIAGDAIHNIRASLDILIFQMIGKSARKPKRIQFPFANSQEDFENEIQRGELYLAGEHVVDYIRKIRPYKGGDDLLSSLHSLDIQDKHKNIIMVHNLSHVRGDVWPKLHSSLINITNLDLVSRITGPVFTVKLKKASRRERRAKKFYKPDCEIINDKSCFEITFSDDEFLNASVGSKLSQIVDRVDKICEQLCRVFVSY